MKAFGTSKRLLLLFCLLVPLTGAFAQKKGKGHGVVEPYSISLLALQGPNATDVYVTVQTSDADFPVPPSLKKLQVKVFNSDGKLITVENTKDVPVTGDQATVSLAGLADARRVEVQVHIKTDQTVDEEVLDGSADVLKRPDLVVSAIDAPAQVILNTSFSVGATIRETNLEVGATATVTLWEGATPLGSVSGVHVEAGGEADVTFNGLTGSSVGLHQYTVAISAADPAEYDDTNNDSSFSILVVSPDLVISEINAPTQASVNIPFSIEAVIAETRLQVGASATVSLYEGESLLGSIPNVQVPAGGQVSAVFQGLTESTTGDHEYTVRISGATPEEFDTTNNDSSFTITFVAAADPMLYSINYNRTDNFYRHFLTTYCDGTYYEETQTGKTETLQYSALANPTYRLHAPFDQVIWEVETESGVVARHDTANLVPYSSSDDGNGTYVDYYEAYNGNSNFYYYLTIGGYPVNGEPFHYVNFQLTKYATNFLYIYHYADGTVDSTHANHDADSLLVSAGSLVKVRLLLSDDGHNLGGEGVSSVEQSHFGIDIPAGPGCPSTSMTIQYDRFHGDHDGTTDPSKLPTGATASVEIPLHASNSPETLPTETELDRNYPNPFNPSTTIRFQLPERRHVTVAVFNMLGQRVATLVDGEMSAGYHNVVWNAGSAPSGVYFVRMQAGAYTAIRRAILTK